MKNPPGQTTNWFKSGKRSVDAAEVFNRGVCDCGECRGNRGGGIVQGCHNDMQAQLPTMIAQQRMIEKWMSWAATCHRGTPEGKAQCLALFTAVQRLKGVPDSCPWVRDLKAEVLA